MKRKLQFFALNLNHFLKDFLLIPFILSSEPLNHFLVFLIVSPDFIINLIGEPPHFKPNQPSVEPHRHRFIILINKSGIKPNPIHTTPEHSLDTYNGLKGPGPDSLIDNFLLIVPKPANGTTFLFIMVLVRAETLEVEDMAAGKNDLMLGLEVLEAD